MRDFQGKTAVVTGAASGIGRALVDIFCDAGVNVVLADVEEKPLASAVAELEAEGHSVLGVGVDTRSRESVGELAKRAQGAFANVHILVNNAGVASLGEGGRGVWEIDDEDWDWVLGVNFHGVLHGLQAFVPGMSRRTSRASCTSPNTPSSKCWRRRRAGASSRLRRRWLVTRSEA